MKKIPTIFDRDWDGNRGVISQYVLLPPADAVATEKLDGTNVRVTLRHGHMVRLEKRRNPSKRQKHIGITDPWYVDADPHDPADKWIYEAADNVDWRGKPDGEWSGEAVGPKIQGNPLNLSVHTICMFSLGEAPALKDAPVTFDGLREWLPQQKSAFGNDAPIEGIVWHVRGEPVCKIKTKDFK